MPDFEQEDDEIKSVDDEKTPVETVAVEAIAAEWFKARQKELDDAAKKKESDRVERFFAAQTAALRVIADAGLGGTVTLDDGPRAQVLFDGYREHDQLHFPVCCDLPDGKRLEVGVKLRRGIWGPLLADSTTRDEAWGAIRDGHYDRFTDGKEAIAFLVASDEDRAKFWPDRR